MTKKLIYICLFSTTLIIGVNNVGAVNIVENNEPSTIDARFTPEGLIRYNGENFGSFNSVLLGIKKFNKGSVPHGVDYMGYETSRTKCLYGSNSIDIFLTKKISYSFSTTSLSYSVLVSSGTINCGMGMVSRLATLYNGSDTFIIGSNDVNASNVSSYAYSDSLGVFFTCLNSTCSTFKQLPVYSYISQNYGAAAVARILFFNNFSTDLIGFKIDDKLIYLNCSTTSCNEVQLDIGLFGSFIINNSSPSEINYVKGGTLNKVQYSPSPRGFYKTNLTGVGGNKYDNIYFGTDSTSFNGGSLFVLKYPNLSGSNLILKSLQGNIFLTTNILKKYHVYQGGTLMGVQHCLMYDYKKNIRIYNECNNGVIGEQFEPDDPDVPTTGGNAGTNLGNDILDGLGEEVEATDWKFNTKTDHWYCQTYGTGEPNLCNTCSTSEARKYCDSCSAGLTPVQFGEVYASCNLPSTKSEIDGDMNGVVGYGDEGIVLYQKKDVLYCSAKFDNTCQYEDLRDIAPYMGCQVGESIGMYGKIFKVGQTILKILIFQNPTINIGSVMTIGACIYDPVNDVYDCPKKNEQLLNYIVTKSIYYGDIMIAIIIFILTIKVVIGRRKDEVNIGAPGNGS